MANNTIEIRITAKNETGTVLDGLNKSFSKLGDVGSSGLGKISSAFGDIAKFAIGGVIANGVMAITNKIGELSQSLVNFGKDSIKAAADTQEMTNLFNVSFGDSADYARKKLDMFSATVGRNKYEVEGFAGRIQSLIKPMGVVPDIAANMSIEFARLAVDLSSFYNVTESDALDALRAGLVGETEPMRRFGVVINESAIKAQAMSMGLVEVSANSSKVMNAQASAEKAQISYNAAISKYGADSTQAQLAQINLETAQRKVTDAMEGGNVVLSSAAKAQATFALIMEQTRLAQGDAANTAGSFTNVMRSVEAIFQELQVTMGTIFLPAFTTVMTIVKEALSGLNIYLNSPEGQAIITQFTEFATNLATVIKPVIDSFVAGSLAWLKMALGELAVKLGEWTAWINGGGIQGIIDWGKSIMETLAPALDWLRFMALPGILAIATSVWGWITGTAIPVIISWANTIYYTYLKPAFDWLYNIALPLLLSTGQSVFAWITGQAIPTIQLWANAIYVQYLKPAWDWLTNTALPTLLAKGQIVWGWITGTAIPTITKWADTIYNYLKPKWDTLMLLFDNFSKKIAPELQQVWEVLNTAWTTKILPSLVKMWDSFMKILDILGIAQGGGVKGQISGVNGVLDTMVVVVDKITPMITYLADTFAKNADQLENFANWLDKVDQQFQLITGSSLAKFISDVVDLGMQLNSLVLPSFLTPGSPTPFELGLRGISSAIKDMPQLNLGGMAGTGNANNTTNNKNVNLTINTPAVMPLQSELQFLNAMA